MVEMVRNVGRVWIRAIFLSPAFEILLGCGGVALLYRKALLSFYYGGDWSGQNLLS
jgi:hypothetical protein